MIFSLLENLSYLNFELMKKKSLIQKANALREETII